MMGSGSLAAFERDVLTLSLESAGPHAAALRAQLPHVVVTRRENSGVGLFVHLAVPSGVVYPSIEGKSLLFGDVIADVPELQYGVGFAVLVRDGRLEMLEGYTFGDERWPTRFDDFRLRRTNGEAPS